jgi:hypothetical protein
MKPFIERERRSAQYLATVLLSLVAQVSRPIHHIVVRQLRLLPLDPQPPRSGVIIAVHQDWQIIEAASDSGSLQQERKPSLAFKDQFTARLRDLSQLQHPLDTLGALLPVT